MSFLKRFRHKPKIEDLYEIQNTLGKGTFSVVKLGTERKTGKQYAIKIIDKKSIEDKQEMIASEIAIMKSIKHDNIINLHDVKETDKRLYIIMEYVTGGELFDAIVERGSYAEANAADLVRQIVSAVKYLHAQGVVHRDLKPENLLLSNRTETASIKIADFGLSKMIAQNVTLMTACGTPGYVAPEVLKCRGYGHPVDLWSIGVITYILLVGFPPFYADSTAQLFEQIMEGRFEFLKPYWDSISSTAKDFVSKLLVVDPNQRMNAEQALNHPWLSEEQSTQNIDGFLDSMKKFNAKRRLKKAMLTTIAINRMKHLVSDLGLKVSPVPEFDPEADVEESEFKDGTSAQASPATTPSPSTS